MFEERTHGVANLETFLIDTKGLIDWVVVKVTTDEGIVGYGEAGANRRLSQK